MADNVSSLLESFSKNKSAASAAVDKNLGLGKGGGGMEPLTAGALLLSSIIGGAFSMWQGAENNAMQEKLHNEEMGMADRQFNLGQTMDRFNMRMSLQEAAAKMNEAQRSQIMDALKTSLALKDRAGNMFSTKGGAM